MLVYYMGFEFRGEFQLSVNSKGANFRYSSYFSYS